MSPLALGDDSCNVLELRIQLNINPNDTLPSWQVAAFWRCRECFADMTV